MQESLPELGWVLLVAVTAVVHIHLLLERRQEEVAVKSKYHDVTRREETLTS